MNQIMSTEQKINEKPEQSSEDILKSIVNNSEKIFINSSLIDEDWDEIPTNINLRDLGL